MISKWPNIGLEILKSHNVSELAEGYQGAFHNPYISILSGFLTKHAFL